MKQILITILFTLFAGSIFAQSDTSDIWFGTVENGDSLIQKQLRDIWVYPGINNMSKRQQRRFWNNVNKIKKVYPYAKKANELLKQYEPEYLKLKSNRAKRKLMNKIEDSLLSEYKDDLKKMTISEGRILIKLIDRETGRTSYTIIQDFRGSFSAFFWQTIAKLFKNDLKSEYDSEGEDRLIEEVVTLIEKGEI